MKDYTKRYDWGIRPERTERPKLRLPGKRSGGGFKKYIGTILLGCFLAGTVSVIGLFAWAVKDFPDPNKLNERQVAQTTTIYDRTGKVALYQIHGDQKRTIVEMNQIADYVKQATISAEDRNFYTHSGIDFKGMLRGAFKSVASGGSSLQSGSTITQQFIKKAVLSDDQTVTRKIKEIILAIELERRYTKDEILKLYLNEIPYGNLSFGIEAASQSYLGKAAKDLTLPEAALLASIPNAPTRYSPYGNHTDQLLARQHYVIEGMVTQGYITRAQADEAEKVDVLKEVKPKREAILAPHFVFYIKDLLAEQFGDQAVEQGGLKVITTLDAAKQVLAEKAINDNIGTIKKFNANNAAMAAIDPKTGDVLTMVGSADYFNNDINGQFNAILGSLQPGSSIKPIVYAAAFEKGYTEKTVVEDLKTEFGTGSQSYSPTNYDGKDHGFVTLKEALAGSLNVPAVKVLYLTGLDAFQDFAKRLGYTTFNDKSRFGLSLVLGGAEVKPIEHIAAYGAFAQEGVIHQTRALLKVTDATGKVLFDAGDAGPGKKVYDPEVARQIIDIISDNSARAYIFGEHNFLTLADRPVAAKTGTTNDFKDAWTVGFTPSLVTGVWVGNSNGSFMKKGADGSQVAAPIWNQFMRTALAGTPVEQFTPPQPVVTGKSVLDGNKNAQVVLNIDRVSGKLATQYTPPEYVEQRGYGVPHSILFFVNKDDPRGPVPEHPEQDPQFANWEAPVAAWAVGKTFENSTPPTETDDVHVPANFPTVSFVSPSEGATIPERTFHPQVAAFANRGVAKVEYLIDDDSIGSAVFAPFDAAMTIPNRFGKGFHKLTARAYDDVGNRSDTSINVNITADPGPLGITWKSPWTNQTVSGNQFPFNVAFSVDDVKSVKALRVYATPEGGQSQDLIGTVDAPPLPSMSFTWKDKPPSGRYDINVEVQLTTGDTRKESTSVYIQ
ncbi:MAG: hypothetical protein RLZZ324_1346 [Candidatus Parcubacteria bacterium]|jgi:penicillin-binding protein 1C